MGKVYRQDRKSVQRIKARDIVPGDIVEVAGKMKTTRCVHGSTACLSDNVAFKRGPLQQVKTSEAGAFYRDQRISLGGF